MELLKNEIKINVIKINKMKIIKNLKMTNYYLQYKKGLVLLTFFLSTMQFFSQEKEPVLTPKNEIKIDVSDIVFIRALDISYERYSSSNFTYGMSVLWVMENNDFYEKFAATPFLRYYFFNKEDFGVKGFFVEAFSKFAFGEYSDSFLFAGEKENYFDVGLGFSVGNKWVSSKGFTAEISFGVGRNLKLNDASPEMVFRGGLSIGYLF